MTSKLLFAFSCSIICLFSCKKSEPELTFPYNFSCIINENSFYLDYDSSFVSLSGMSTSFNERTKTLKMNGYSYFSGNDFHIEIKNFSDKGILNSDSIVVLFKDETALNPSVYDYELDRMKSIRFEILDYDNIKNEAKGTFNFTLKPIIDTRGLKPKVISFGKFRFKFR